MTQEEKELLLKDLCARLPYGVKIELMPITRGKCVTLAPVILQDYFISDDVNYLPLLRPMSSMTEEEKQEWYKQSHVGYDPEYKTDPTLSLDNCHLSIDWLNSHHFDYRGLIEKGLALEAPKNMYK